MFGIDPVIMFLGVFGLVVLAVTGATLAGIYHKCAPNHAMIISGMSAAENGRPFKIVVGGGALVLPVVQQRFFLSLEPTTVNVPISSLMLTRDRKSITLDITGVVRVKNDPDSIATAAENLLGKTGDEITEIARQIIGGHTRSVLLSLTVDELAQSLSSVAERIQEISAAELSKIGLTLVTLTLKDIKDGSGEHYPFSK